MESPSISDSVQQQSQQLGERAQQELSRIVETDLPQIGKNPFVWAAAASVLASLSLRLSGKTHDALFVGQWAPTLLVAGLYLHSSRGKGTMDETMDYGGALN